MPNDVIDNNTQKSIPGYFHTWTIQYVGVAWYWVVGARVSLWVGRVFSMSFKSLLKEELTPWYEIYFS